MRHVARTDSIVGPGVIAGTSSPLRESPVWRSVVFITGSLPELTYQLWCLLRERPSVTGRMTCAPRVVDWHARGPRLPGPRLRTGDVVRGRRRAPRSTVINWVFAAK